MGSRVSQAFDNAGKEQRVAVDGYQEKQEVDAHSDGVDIEQSGAHGWPGEVLFLDMLGVRSSVEVEPQAVSGMPLLLFSQEFTLRRRMRQEEEGGHGDDNRDRTLDEKNLHGQ